MNNTLSDQGPRPDAPEDLQENKLQPELQEIERCDDNSELSAPLSDVEPETTATAARNQSKKAAAGRVKRSYKTVDPLKRSQLIQMVHKEQKTIKEAANRLQINYSTAKHIIKSKKTVEQPSKSESAAPAQEASNEPLGERLPRIDIETLERKIQALTEPSQSLYSTIAGGPPKTFNSSLLSNSASLGQSLSLYRSIPPSSQSQPLRLSVPSAAVINVPPAQPS